MTLATSSEASGPIVPPQPATASIPRNTLRDALNRLVRIIPQRSANPGLTLITLEFEPDRLTLKGANQDTSMQISIAVETRATRVIATPAAPLAQIINNAPADSIMLEATSNELQVASGTYKTRLQLADPNSAPSIEFPTDLEHSMPAQALNSLLDKVRFAAATADFQAVFRGIYLHFTPARARAVATDGFRLAYYDVDPVPGLELEALVMAKNTIEISRAFPDGDVRVGIRNNRLALESDTTRLTVSLMDGQFPDYQRVIPTMFEARITLEARTLVETLQRVALMSEKTANNRVDLHLKSGRLTLSGEGQYGSAQEVLEVQHSGQADELMLAVNAKFLTDASNAEGAINLNLNQGNAAPMTIVDAEDPKYLSMLVPLRTT